jgi:hypothetical protein
MKMNRWMVLAGVTAALTLGGNQTFAQNNNNQDQGQPAPGRNRGPGGGGGGRGNFDPAQAREWMMNRYKEALEITDDTEWNAIEPLVQKVMDSRVAGIQGMGRMFGRNRGGGNGGDNGGNGGNTGGGGRAGMFGQPSPETEALQKAVDAKAGKEEMKAAIAKYNDYKKSKQVELEKAQAALRKVLTVRQEALATLNGLL